MSIQKNVIDRFQSIVSGDMSGNLTSSFSDIRFMDNLGLQIKWTSANAVGVLTVECSNSYQPDKNIAGTWVALTFSPALSQPASNNGDFLVNLNQLPYAYMRVVYTRTSGTGTLNVWVQGKEQ